MNKDLLTEIAIDMDSAIRSRNDRNLAILWSLTLGSTLVSEGPSVFISMIVKPRVRPSLLEETRGNRMEVRIRQEDIERFNIDNSILWISSSIGLMAYLVSVYIAVKLFKNCGSQRIHGILAFVLQMMLLGYTVINFGKGAHVADASEIPSLY